MMQRFCGGNARGASNGGKSLGQEAALSQTLLLCICVFRKGCTTGGTVVVKNQSSYRQRQPEPIEANQVIASLFITRNCGVCSNR
jgi:hypothetical protein